MALFLDGGVIEKDDPTSFKSLEFLGECNPRMYDRRDRRFKARPAYCFDFRLNDELKVIRVNVNQEYSFDDAHWEADYVC